MRRPTSKRPEPKDKIKEKKIKRQKTKEKRGEKPIFCFFYVWERGQEQSKN
jgi:hypothetical protein